MVVACDGGGGRHCCRDVEVGGVGSGVGSGVGGGGGGCCCDGDGGGCCHCCDVEVDALDDGHRRGAHMILLVIIRNPLSQVWV